jgi:hypothetical protein
LGRGKRRTATTRREGEQKVDEAKVRSGSKADSSQLTVETAVERDERVLVLR